MSYSLILCDQVALAPTTTHKLTSDFILASSGSTGSDDVDGEGDVEAEEASRLASMLNTIVINCHWDDQDLVR